MSRVLKYIDVNPDGDTEWELDRMTIRTDASPDAVWGRVTGRYSTDAQLAGPMARERSAAETADVPGASIPFDKLQASSTYGRTEPVSAYPLDMDLGRLLDGLLQEASNHCITATSLALGHNPETGEFTFTLELPDGNHVHVTLSKGGAREICNQIDDKL